MKLYLYVTLKPYDIFKVKNSLLESVLRRCLRHLQFCCLVYTLAMSGTPGISYFLCSLGISSNPNYFTSNEMFKEDANVIVLVTGGCWPQFHRSPQHSSSV